MPFLTITQLSDKVVDYDTRMTEFTNAVRLFYEVGGKIFLTKHVTGDDETFYMHVL